MIKDGYSIGRDMSHCSQCKSFYSGHCHEVELCIFGAFGKDTGARNKFKPEDKDSGKFIYMVKPVFNRVWRS